MATRPRNSLPAAARFNCPNPIQRSSRRSGTSCSASANWMSSAVPVVMPALSTLSARSHRYRAAGIRSSPPDPLDHDAASHCAISSVSKCTAANGVGEVLGQATRAGPISPRPAASEAPPDHAGPSAIPLPQAARGTILSAPLATHPSGQLTIPIIPAITAVQSNCVYLPPSRRAFRGRPCGGR